MLVLLVILTICATNVAYATSNTDLTSKVDDISVAELRRLIVKLADRVEHLEMKERNSEEKILRLEGELIGRLSNHSSSKRTRRQSEYSNIAFYAHVDRHLNNLATNQIIRFDRTYTNTGNAYDPNTGIFRAPVRGLYVFSMTLKCASGHNEHYFLTKNDFDVGDLYIHGSVSFAASASRMAILDLYEGDKVTVKNAYQGEGVYGQGHSSFAGFLLQDGRYGGQSIITG